jgi:hypothetical protein
MVAMIEMIWKPAIRAALMQPMAIPKTPANRSPTIQPPPPTACSANAVRYWATDAPTAKEISMPPAIRTTSSPTAQMTLTALLFINDAKFPALKKVGETTPRYIVKAARTMNRRASPAWVRK